MATSRPNEKGADFERSVCTKLSLWVSGGLREDLFWRSAMSGGRANLAHRRARGANFKAQSGDITAVHPDGAPLLEVFLIECKFWEDLGLGPMCFKTYGKLGKAWEKTVDQAAEEERLPIMVVKQNRKHPLIILNGQGMYLYSIMRRIYEDDTGNNVTLEPAHVTFPEIDAHLFYLTDLLTIQYGYFDAAAKELRRVASKERRKWHESS